MSERDYGWSPPNKKSDNFTIFTEDFTIFYVRLFLKENIDYNNSRHNSLFFLQDWYARLGNSRYPGSRDEDFFFYS